MLRFNSFETILLGGEPEFQYILCCGSTLNAWQGLCLILISIHLMLRFNETSTPRGGIFIVISIHLMLRFNLLWVYLFLIYQEISIHLMLRFNYNKKKRLFQAVFYFNTSYVAVQLFLFSRIMTMMIYFNTSYVAVQHSLLKIFLIWLYNFNTSYVAVQRKKARRDSQRKAFQYILCCGSTLCGYTFYFFHHIKKALKLQYFPLFFPMISAVWAKIKK